MNGSALHKTAADCAEELPGAQLEYPSHMNKRHWITLESGEGVGKELVRGLVTDSYLLVVAHLPRAERPVDPRSCGTGTRASR